MRLILYGHDECSLCDRLERMLQPHLKHLGVMLEKRNIKDDRQWLRTYRHRIPVLTCNGEEILEGRPEWEDVERVMRGLSGEGR